MVVERVPHMGKTELWASQLYSSKCGKSTPLQTDQSPMESDLTEPMGAKMATWLVAKLPGTKR